MDPFGEQLRALRQAARLRQQDLATALGGIGRSTIANVEGGRQQPSERLWSAIGTAFPEWIETLEPAYEHARHASALRRRSIADVVDGLGAIPTGPLGGPYIVESVHYTYVFRHSRAPEEIVEQRRVRALRGGATGYGLWLAQTRSPDFNSEYEALWGGSLTEHEVHSVDGVSVVLVRFDFDRPLRRNQVHDFALRSWVTADPEPATAVSTTFTIPAREASIHLHFHGPEKPSSFWEYRVDPADPTEPGGIDEFTPPSNPDDAAWRYVDAKGSISLVLREPTIGVEYGLSWAW